MVRRRRVRPGRGGAAVRSGAVDLLPEQWGWWLKNFRGHAPSIGWPEVEGAVAPPAGLPTYAVPEESVA